jgi:thiol-disulfide isomerase/thioredoxin
MRTHVAAGAWRPAHGSQVPVAACLLLIAALACVAACAARTPADLTRPAAVPAKATPANPSPSPALAPASPVSSPAAVPATPASGPGVAAAPAKPRPPAPVPLVGHVTRADLEEYVTWKELRAQDYVPDPAALATIAERGRNVTVLAIVGTWCSDSKREVPRFFKIADQAKFPLAAVTVVAVDRTKKDADGLTEKHAITRVPTFVFFRDGREIGRVTEKAATTLENDIATIVSK